MSSPHRSPSDSSKTRENKTSMSQKSRKFMNVTVYFLDDSSHVFQLQAKNLGQVLFEKVCKFLNVYEVDYFGLEYEDEKGTKCWLDALKPLCSQIATSFPTMYFCVKFYTPDPVQLEDEFTRYLFGLQIKKDLAAGLLQCNDNTAAVMISYVVQADIGDCNPEKHLDSSYLSGYKFVPYQDAELELKIMENHKKIVGQTPAEADLNLLETSRRCELYGIKMTPAKDHEGVPLNLAVAHLGVLVFQNFTKINTFSWAKIRKLSFKRKKFLIKLHPEGYGYYKDTVEFFFEGRNECKNFWKKCIENHTFFRCTDAKQGMRQKPKIFSRGSSFRYSGRTQKQVSQFVRENCLKRPPFQRSTSLRTASSPSRSGGTSASPQPLLPITSLSCGSISDIPKEPAPVQRTFSTSEPTTPHIALEVNHSMNGPCSKTVDAKETPGLVSPDFECDQEGFQSPDILAQDTDDNISHDSYHVLEKEIQKVNAECITNTNNLTNNITECEVSTAVLTNGTKECDVTTENGDLAKIVSEVTCKPENNNNILKELIHLDNCNKNEDIVNLDNIKHMNFQSCDVSDENLKTNNVINKMSGPIKVEAFIEHVPREKSESQSSVSLNRLSGGANYSDNQKNEDQILFTENIEQVSSNCSLLNESHQSFGSSTFYISSPLAARLGSTKKTPADQTYCYAKELLMTERTYRKDLEVINVVFRDEFNKQGTISSKAVDVILSEVDPLYEIHCSLLRDLEQRLAFWEGRPTNKLQNGIKGIGDILVRHKELIELHCTYIEELQDTLKLVDKELVYNLSMAHFYQQFESHKICYLPLTSFMLRPAFRLFYYSSIVKSLLKCYDNQHVDYNYCKDIYESLEIACEKFENHLAPLVNYVKLMELQRSLMGFPSLLDQKREFIREGCLLKFSKSGSHQHMFFLFSDILVYTTRVHSGQLCFKVQGQLPTFGLKVEEAEPKHGVSHCLTVCGGEKHILIAASSEREYSKWFRDLKRTVKNAQDKQIISNTSSQLQRAFTNDRYESSDDTDDASLVKDEKPASHVNTSIHICWHRNISISSTDLLLSMKHSLSGYLLRKFNNNSGWQKLWVVLANLCLFFYKTYLDKSPLASLPLAGYKITNTSSNDTVSGECIFKLQFKNHEYFFLVENKYAFERWMEAVSICTLMDEENTRL